MIRLTKMIQVIFRFAWNGWHKNNVRFPAYVLVRTHPDAHRCSIGPPTEQSERRSTQDNPNIKQVYRSW